MRILITSIGLLLALSGKAQLVRNSATMVKNDGTAVLLDSVRIYATDLSDGQYTAVIFAKVHGDFIALAEDSTVLEGAKLYHSKDSIIGSVSGTFEVDTLWPSTARRMSKYYDVVLSGKVSSKDLHRKSFPTLQIEDFFSSNRGAIYEKLTDELKVTGWTTKSFGEYEAWSYMNDQSTPWAPEFQALIIFRSGIPYCLVNQGEAFDYEKVKAKEKRNTGTYYFFQRPNDRFFQEIEDIVYDYIPL